MTRLVDMHMHIGFAEKPALFARELDERGISAFANTVTMEEYAKLAPLLDDADNMRLGLGMHPWWIGLADDGALDAALREFDAMLESTRYVGEIGLDFYPTRDHAEREQHHCFEHIVRSCADLGGRLVSIHAVKSEETVLDVLERTGCTQDNSCILHSYGGSPESLTRAMRMGLFFSIGKRTLSSKRGREYARTIPLDQLLIETDLPATPRDDCAPGDIENALDAAIDDLAAIRSEDRDVIADAIVRTSMGLLNA